MSDHAGQALLYAVLLVLPVAALLGRRVPMGTLVRYAAIWIAIFVLGLFLIRLTYGNHREFT